MEIMRIGHVCSQNAYGVGFLSILMKQVEFRLWCLVTIGHTMKSPLPNLLQDVGNLVGVQHVGTVHPTDVSIDRFHLC